MRSSDKLIGALDEHLLATAQPEYSEPQDYQGHFPTQHLADEASVYLPSVHLLAKDGIRPVPTIIPGFLAKVGLTIWAGRYSSGKTTIADYTALCLLKGLDWFESEIDRTYRVMKIDADQASPNSALSRLLRLDAARSPEFLPENDEGEDAPRAFAWNHDPSFDLERAERLEWLEKAITYHRSEVIIIDSLSAVFPNIDHDNNAQVRRVTQPLVALSKRLEVAIVFLAHSGKNPNAKGSWCRGAQSIVDLLEIGVHVKPNRSEGTPDYVTLINKKGRDWEGDDPTLVRYTRRTGGEDAPIHLEPMDGPVRLGGRQDASSDRRQHRVPLLALGTRSDGIQRKDYLERVGDSQESSVNRIAKELKESGLLEPEGRAWTTTHTGRAELERLDPNWQDHLAEFEETGEWPET